MLTRNLANLQHPDSPTEGRPDAQNPSRAVPQVWSSSKSRGSCSVVCPRCDGELSKKWKPQGVKRADPVVAWSCGVCGGQFTRAELAHPVKRRKQSAPLDDLLPIADSSSR